MGHDSTFGNPRSHIDNGQAVSSTNCPRLTAQKFLLDLIRVPSGESTTPLRLDIAHKVDWANLFGIAYKEGMAPLAYDAICRYGMDQWDYVPTSRFEYVHRLVGRVNQQRQLHLAGVLRKFQELEIPVILLKGATFSAHLYPDMALRPSKDMDLLVQQRDVDRAHAGFKKLGYSLNYKGNPIVAPDDRDVTYRSGRQYFHPGRDHASIDLYWQLSRYPYLFPIDYEQLWRRATRVILEGIPTLALSPADTILHLSLDFTMDLWYGQPELRTLRDIAEVTHRHRVNWDDLLMDGSQAALRNALYYSCALAQELCGAAVPEDALLRIYPGPGRFEKWAAGYVERHIFDLAHPLKYVALAIMMRLAGREGPWAKTRWLSKLAVPPKELWGSIPRSLSRMVAGETK